MYQNQTSKPRRGEIWYYEPEGYLTGSLMMGARPVLVVGADYSSALTDTYLIIPMTTAIKGDYPHHVLRYSPHTDKVSVYMCEQMRAVNGSELDHRLEVLSNATMEKIMMGVKFALGIIPVDDNEQMSNYKTVNPDRPSTNGKQDDVEKIKDDSKDKDEIETPFSTTWPETRAREFVAAYEAWGKQDTAEVYELTENTAYTYYRRFKNYFKQSEDL